MVPIRNAIHIPPNIFFGILKGNTPATPEVLNQIRQRSREDPVEEFFGELLWWAKILQRAREEIS